MRESEIEAYLVKRAEACGGEVRKMQWIGRRGAPDRLLMLPTVVTNAKGWASRGHRTIWVELKAPGKAPPAYQLREHERMRKMGQHVEVIDSLAAVDALLA